MTRYRAAISALLLAGLAACGGGGGSGGGGASGPSAGPPPPPSPVPTTLLALTSTNAQDVASGATLTGLGSASLGSQFQNSSPVGSPYDQELSPYYYGRRFRGEAAPDLSELADGNAEAIGMQPTKVTCRMFVSASFSLSK